MSKSPHEILEQVWDQAITTEHGSGYTASQHFIRASLAEIEEAVLTAIPDTRLEYHDPDCDAYKGVYWCHCSGKSAAEKREALERFRKAILTMFEGE